MGVHDCQKLMGFFDTFQEMNDMATKLTSTKLNDSSHRTDITLPVNLDGDINGIGVESSQKSQNPNVEGYFDVSNIIEGKIGAEIDDGHSNTQVVQQVVEVIGGEVVVNLKNMKTIPEAIQDKTRQSSRLKDAQDYTLKKFTAGNTKHKGISSSLTPPHSNPSNSLEILASVCGFSLGPNEEARIANISLIQAKEEALLALRKTKQKLTKLSEGSLPSSQDHRSNDESSENLQVTELEVLENGANIYANLLVCDQG